MEVAQRLKEMKLMTQPGVGPLAPVAGRLSADPLVDPGTTKAIEGQIALLTKRIKSIADYMQVWMVEGVLALFGFIWLQSCLCCFRCCIASLFMYFLVIFVLGEMSGISSCR